MMSIAGQRYCIDSSCFIDMRINQPPDVFEGLWNNMLNMIDGGDLLVHRLVREEVMSKDDDASHWMKKVALESLVEIDQAQSGFITQLSSDYRYMAHLIQQREYAKKADPFLVALGVNEHCRVVTNEGPQEWKIPDLCNRYGIRTLGHLQFVREMGWKF